jgi:uncharacterized membrane protein YgcG
MKIKGNALSLLLATMVAGLLSFPGACRSAQDERILLFESLITVHPDASMTVRETIRARSAGQEIKRGIYRDFPTQYRDRYGNRVMVAFEVLEVLRDGKPDGFHFEDLVNGKRIYVGKKDVFLPAGSYTYVLVYKTNRQLGFFKDHDELYWNVTGNGWAFPIDKATATVQLPPGIARSQLRLEAYTGPQGAAGEDFQSAVDAGGKITFTTNRPLGPQEGLTIVVSWPKGVVAEPATPTKIGYFLQDNGSAFAGLLGLAILLGYYLVVWSMVGKDPQEGTIIPLYEPPAGLSPAAMRYISKMGYDDQVFTAAIIDMAVKGWLSVSEQDGVYTLVRSQAKNAALAPEESKIIAKLLGSADRVELKQTNHATIKSGIDALKGALKTACEKNYFVTNRAYFIPGLVLSAVVSVVMLLCSPSATGIPAVFICVWLSGWTVAVIFLLARVVSSWKEFIHAGSGRFFAFIVAAGATLFALPFLGGEIMALYFLTAVASVWVVVFIVVIGAANVLFYQLLKAPTRMGRQILDKIEGFKRYLTVAEKDRLNILYPPEKTPELFEKYLPHALALGVGQQWAEQFAEVLARAGQSGSAYAPAWYFGHAWDAHGPTGFAHSFGSSFSSAVSSSSTAPGSSSGSGGGGSSGGGGGGGGGGGW